MSLSFLAAGVVLAVQYHNAIHFPTALHALAEAIYLFGLRTRAQTPIFVPAFCHILDKKEARTRKVRRYGETPGQEVRRD